MKSCHYHAAFTLTKTTSSYNVKSKTPVNHLFMRIPSVLRTMSIFITIMLTLIITK